MPKNGIFILIANDENGTLTCIPGAQQSD